MSAPPLAPDRRRAGGWPLAAMTTLAMAISYIDRQTLAVLSPTITRALGFDDVAYGWLGTGFSLAYLLAGPLAGVWIDRVGARRGLLWSVVVWSVVAALHALAPGFGVLFALRLALGVAEAPTFPAGVQAMQRGLDGPARTRGMSLLFVGMSLGGMLAPGIAVGIAARFGWRAAFLGTAAIAALWAPAWSAVSSRPGAREALDATGAPAAPAAASIAQRLAVAGHPAVKRGLLGLVAIVPASAFAMAWEARYYVRQFGLTQAGLAPYLVASAVAYDLGALVFADLAARRAPPQMLFAAGAACAAVGLAGLAFAPGRHVALAFFLASAVGRGAVVTLCNTDALARVPRASVSAAGGVIASVQSLGAIVTNPALGYSVARVGYPPALLFLAAWTIPGTLLWLFSPRPRARRT